MSNDFFHLGLFQYDVQWENPDENIRKIENLITTLKTPLDLLLLPEMFTTGFTMNPTGKALNELNGLCERLTRLSKQLKTPIAGSVIWRDGPSYYNRFILINEQGIQSHYDKSNLFTLGGETKAYQPGKTKATWIVKNWKLLPFVCYDLRFPEWCRNSEEADLMLYAANWPESRHEHWLNLLTARAIENQCYVAGVNRIGIDGNQISYLGGSKIIDPNGLTVANAQAQEALIHVKLSRDLGLQQRNRFPFLKDRNNREKGIN